MMILGFKTDADVSRLTWSRPDSVIAPFCSLCQQHIPDDAVPLRMWNTEGWTVHFCDECVERYIEIVS